VKHLVEERQISWSYYNQVVSALRFLYKVTLDRPEIIAELPRPRRERRLPTVLSAEEIVRLLDAVENPKHRLLLLLAYGAGLRVSEVVGLRVADIDSDRMTIRVRQGKGRKDRLVMLSPVLLEELRTYWRRSRPMDWLFPGQQLGRPLTTRAVQPARTPLRRRAWPPVDDRSACTRCATASRRTCSRPVRICA
jgi:integrase